MAVGALIVFTAKTVEAILAAGGTQSWVLNPSNMTRIEYVVCTRNADRAYDEECGPRSEPHRAAFLVGRVSGLRKVGERNGRDRYIIIFSEYAEVMIPEFRGHERNPVTYGDTDSLRLKGLDVSTLNFIPMPEDVDAAKDLSSPIGPAEGMSIDEAKKGLSLRYDVPVSAIQIVITG